MRAADFQGVIVTTAVRNPVRVPCMSDVMKSLRKLENFLRSIIWVWKFPLRPPVKLLSAAGLQASSLLRIHTCQPARTKTKCMHFYRSHAWFRTGTHDSRLDVMIALHAAMPQNPFTHNRPDNILASFERPDVIFVPVLAVQVMPRATPLLCAATQHFTCRCSL